MRVDETSQNTQLDVRAIGNESWLNNLDLAWEREKSSNAMNQIITLANNITGEWSQDQAHGFGVASRRLESVLPGSARPFVLEECWAHKACPE